MYKGIRTELLETEDFTVYGNVIHFTVDGKTYRRNILNRIETSDYITYYFNFKGEVMHIYQTIG